MERSLFILLFCCFGGITGFQPALFAQQPAPETNSDTSIRIVVLAGQNGVNILKPKRTAPPIVEVSDASGRALPAAIVTFSAPESGPTVVFSNGRRLQSVVTELNGRATVADMEPAGAGPFKMTVITAYEGHFASQTIEQTNFMNESSAISAGVAPNWQTKTAMDATHPRYALSKRAALAILGSIAAGAAVGLALSLSHGKAASPAGTISVGTPSVGAPH